MARLDSASRLRWPRRIIVSMTSLRNRLAAAPSPSSPVRSRYSHATWKDSSSNWEREMVMGGKRTKTPRVPYHLRLAARFPLSTATGSDRKKTSPKTWNSDVSSALQTAASASRGLPRRSVRVRPPAFRHRQPSVRGSQPAHGEFDRAVRQFAPPFDLAHVGSLRIRLQKALALARASWRGRENVSARLARYAPCAPSGWQARSVGTWSPLQQITTSSIYGQPERTRVLGL